MYIYILSPVTGKAKKKISVFTVTCGKKIGSVGRIYFFCLIFFFILKFSEFGFLESLFVMFLYSLTVLNTLSTVIDDIIPFGSRKRQKFPRH
jgi:hypothetical protein